MPTPQPAVLPAGGAHAYFLTFTVDAGVPPATVIKAIGDVRSFARALAGREKRSMLLSALGFGSEFWDRVSPGRRPTGLRPFRAIQADGREAPATGGDLFFHITSGRHDLNLDRAMSVVRRLRDVATLNEEVHGFRYLDSRDLTGFIDGTENPKGKAAAAAALIGNEDRTFAGGSYVAVQRYIHNLDRWRQLDDREQEQIIGRTKRGSVELRRTKKPPTAHISRVVIERDGAELQILRQSYPWGTVREAGLYFIAYTKSLDIFELMLSRMVGTAGDGLHDRLMDFSRPVTGATFFVPSVQTLAVLQA
jgi:putative iron-dependent peroxidase